MFVSYLIPLTCECHLHAKGNFVSFAFTLLEMSLSWKLGAGPVWSQGPYWRGQEGLESGKRMVEAEVGGCGGGL